MDKGIVFLIPAILALLHVMTADADHLLVKNSSPHSVIVIEEDATEFTKLAANDLRYHLRRASGSDIPVLSPVQADNLTGETVRLYVGPSTFTTEHGIDTAGLEPEQYVVKSIGRDIVFVGHDKDEPTSLWAVCHFLDRELGVRWLWPGDTGTHVPRSTTITVPTLDVTARPALESRNIRIRKEGEPALWNLHQMMGSRSIYRFGHCFRDWWEKYGEKHPEYFAVLEEGKKQPSPVADRVKLCVSNPAVADRIIEEWKEAGMPDNWCVGPNDSRDFCTCERCQALDRLAQPTGIYDPDNLTGRYISLWNGLLRRMKALNPQATLSSYAYSAYREPPLGMKIENGIVLGFVNTYSAYDAWRKWQEAGAKLVLRPNWWHMGALAPHLPLHRAGEFFKFAQAHSMVALSFDSCMGYWGTQGPYYYLIARLAVRPELSVDDVIDEYCSAFGKAAPTMRRYIDYWESYTEDAAYTVPAGGSLSQDSNGLYERAVREHGLPIHPLSGGWRVLPYLYTDDVLKRAHAILDEAMKLTAGEDPLVIERIQFFREGLSFLRETRDIVALVWAEELPDGMTQDDLTRRIRTFVQHAEELSPRHVIWGDVVYRTMVRRGAIEKKLLDLSGM